MQERDKAIAGFVPTEYFYAGQKDKTLAFVAFVVSVFSLLTVGFAGLGTLCWPRVNVCGPFH